MRSVTSSLRWLDKLENLPAEQSTIAAHGFLSLLMRLRRVLLHDCASLQQRHPNHLLFRHDLFQTDLFKDFAERVVIRSQTAEAPMDLQFQQVMPQKHSRMDTMRGMMELRMKDIQTVVQEGFDAFRSGISPVCNDLANIQSSPKRDQLALATGLRLLAESLGCIVNGTFETRLRLDDEPGRQEESSSSGSGQEPPSLSLTERLETVSASSLAIVSAQATEGTNVAATNSTNQPSTDPLACSSSTGIGPPAHVTATDGVFVMETNHTTVQQLWKEWTVGVFGRVPVRKMVAEGFRRSEGQRKLLARRKVVIDEIKRQARERTELESIIISHMDQHKARKKLSITKLQDLIKQRAQDGETVPFWLE
ncbi:hypothetical protein NCC49_003244 [Naganishia albida]|nr:hypothetical protein NCC49_003244 [Naganishia albida]